MSGYEAAHLPGWLQEHTNPEEVIRRTAYLLVLYWWLALHIWIACGF